MIIKFWAVLFFRGAFAFFFSSHPGAFVTPNNLPFLKKKLMPGVGPGKGGWALLDKHVSTPKGPPKEPFDHLGPDGERREIGIWLRYTYSKPWKLIWSHVVQIIHCLVMWSVNKRKEKEKKRSDLSTFCTHSDWTAKGRRSWKEKRFTLEAS